MKLLANAGYRNYFINRCADLLNTTLLPQSVSALIDSLAGAIRKDITFETLKWAPLKYNAVASWESHIDNLKDFITQRNQILRNQFSWYFDLNGKCTVSIENNDVNGGSIRLNTLGIMNPRWSGIYYKNVPIELEAEPYFGYRFDHWEGVTDPQNMKIQVTPTADVKIMAVFEKNLQMSPLVINEINYHSKEDNDAKDWVEIFNPNTEPVPLSGWTLKDEDDLHSFIIPVSTVIAANGYLVLCEDQTAFQAIYQKTMPVIGDFDFGLGNGGDVVRLFDQRDALIDSVAYRDEDPWPRESDGQGPSLALLDPHRDNALPASWRPGTPYGSPGSENPHPILSMDKDSLVFVEYIGKTQAAVQFLAVGSRTNPWLEWKASVKPEQSWISLIECGNHAGDSLGIRIDGEGLPEGFHQATLLITDSVAIPPVLQVAVSFCRIGVPEIQLDADSLMFGKVPFENPKAALTLVIKNRGTGLLSWSCGSDCPWLFLSDSSGLGDDSLSIVADLSCFSAGPYSDTLMIMQEGIFPDTICLPVFAEKCKKIDPIICTVSRLDTAWVGQMYTDTLDAEGGIPPYRWLVPTDSLPAGLFLADTSGIIHGFPEAAGDYSVDVFVIDSQTPPDSLEIVLEMVIETIHPSGVLEPVIPDRTYLYPNFPNPFNGATWIAYDLHEPADVSIEIYDILGRKIVTLLDERRLPGRYLEMWRCLDAGGSRIQSGLYFCVMKAGHFCRRQKLIFLK